MHDFSRPLAEAVKKARYKMKLTQEQVGELTDTNARTISAIENGQSNTRMNILYPLIRVLRIDPNEIFHSERYTSSSTKDQLLALIEDCSDEEVAAYPISSCKDTAGYLSFARAERISRAASHSRSWLCRRSSKSAS